MATNPTLEEQKKKKIWGIVRIQGEELNRNVEDILGSSYDILVTQETSIVVKPSMKSKYINLLFAEITPSVYSDGMYLLR